MNNLPQVLQNEIWEYVRGDRAYWKQQFKPILKIVEFIDQELLHRVCEFRDEKRDDAFVYVGQTCISLVERVDGFGMLILFLVNDCIDCDQVRGIQSLDTAVRVFYARIESEVMRLKT